REDWIGSPLLLQYFGEAFAGVKFFERLDGVLERPEQEADVIEIYYLCLLLGYKGKYHTFLEDQLPGVVKNVEEKLRLAGRLNKNILAPHWLAKDHPEPPAPAPELPRWVKMSCGVALAAVALAYLLFSLLLILNLNSAKQILLK